MRLPFSRTFNLYIAEKQLTRQLKKENWIFSAERLNMILKEGTDWQENYLPINVKDKTVLDVGAGQGETARLYIQAGAKKVVCIEPDERHFKILKENATKHHEIEPINDIFKPWLHLQLPHDFVKMDIEGYEQQLLDADISLNNPAVLEIHGLQLKDAFGRRGFRLAKHVDTDWWTCYGFWRC